MRKATLLFLAIISIQVSFGQLTKGNWLVGGAGEFSAYSETSKIIASTIYTQNVKAFNISVSPNIGYFIKDRFVVGLRPSLIWGKGKAGDAVALDGSIVGSGGRSNQFRFVAGPFTRYYLLDTDKPFNILVEAAYQYGIGNPKPVNEKINIFSAGVGPVIYFNSSVGLEFILGYNNTALNTDGYHTLSRHSIQLAVGLQVHLEK